MKFFVLDDFSNTAELLDFYLPVHVKFQNSISYRRNEIRNFLFYDEKFNLFKFFWINLDNLIDSIKYFSLVFSPKGFLHHQFTLLPKTMDFKLLFLKI